MPLRKGFEDWTDPPEQPGWYVPSARVVVFSLGLVVLLLTVLR